MKKNIFFKTALLICSFLFFSSATLCSQNKQEVKKFLENDLANYQETVYTHLNKSTYIKGEEIGFTSYLFNKKTKKPTLFTSNLYCGRLLTI
jgi:uncharacterized membrane protein